MALDQAGPGMEDSFLDALCLLHAESVRLNYLWHPQTRDAADEMVLETVLNPGLRFDSVRGVFLEGQRVCPGAGFRRETHIQICAPNPECIKGYFGPTM